MGNIVNVAFQGGMHGHYLRFCIDKFSTLTPDIVGTPFNDNNTSHKPLDYSGMVELYHPGKQEPFFKNTDEPHILVTIEKEDVLFIERWVTLRANDFKIDVSQNKISLNNVFLENFIWADKFREIYNIDLTKESIPKFLMRDFYKLSFLDLNKNGFIEHDNILRTHKPKNTFCFPLSSFWDKDKFFRILREASDYLDLKLDISDRHVHDDFIAGLNFLESKNRADDVIQAIQNNQDIDISALDVVEQAYVSAWIEKNNKFVIVPLCDQFFQSTGEILHWLKNYPEHYKAMNPNLPKFNNIPNPFYLWNLKK